MLGVGYQELFLIGLAALLLFGPGKLPEVMGQAGKWYKQFRDVTSELTGEFEKTVAEAKNEMGDLGLDLGPMQKQVNSITKSVQKDLGGTKGTVKKTTSTGSKAKSTTGAKSSASKSTSSSKSTGKTTSSRTSTGSGATRTNTTKPNMTTGKPVVVASKEDPFANVSMFEQAERKPTRRARAATPSVFTDPTPRDVVEMEPVDDVVTASAPANIVIDSDDPIARARQRRLKAGYAQATVTA